MCHVFRRLPAVSSRDVMYEALWLGCRGALEEKRVSNNKLKQHLGVQLAYPTYREGLAAIAAGDLRPFQ